MENENNFVDMNEAMHAVIEILNDISEQQKDASKNIKELPSKEDLEENKKAIDEVLLELKNGLYNQNLEIESLSIKADKSKASDTYVKFWLAFAVFFLTLSVAGLYYMKFHT